ncbi:MAG: hypothetical protein WCG97_03885 [bacterium]
MTQQKNQQPLDKKNIREDVLLKMQPLFQVVLKRAKGIQPNDGRDSYAPWFKEAVFDLLQTPGITFQEVSNLTAISIRTLENFKEFTDKLKLEKGKITEFHLLVEQAWEMATNLEKKDSTSS